MRRTTTKSRPKSESRNPTSSENEMTGLGLFTSSSTSSSSSSSNLSPLAQPFTVERPNNNNNNSNKFNSGTNLDTHFNFNANFQSLSGSQGLVSDSIRTAATVGSGFSTFSNPKVNSNRSSNSVGSLSVIGPNHGSVCGHFSASSASANNWSSMNSSVKSGLEGMKPPAAGNLYGVGSDAQVRKWSFGNVESDESDDEMPLNFNLLPFGSSQGSYGQSLFGSKFNEQSQGKESTSMFGGRHVSREKAIGSTTFGNSHGTSSSSICHGHGSSGMSSESTFAWNPSSFRFDHYPSSDHISQSMTTKALDVNSTSLFNNNSLWVSHDPLKEKESFRSVGVENKSSLNTQQIPDTNSAKEVNSPAHVEYLEYHNPGEDSPCWKGAPSHYPSSGSQEKVPPQLPTRKVQKNTSENVLLHMDQTLRGVVENDANVVTSESFDVNMVVKGLSNLSEMLLRLYLKDECRLKEHDYKALDRAVANINVCISSGIQEVDSAQKCSSPMLITSNTLREAVHLPALHQEKKHDQLDNNTKELHSAYMKDEVLPKDYNMIQKIQSVLGENLDCTEDLPSDPLLYKNLWLEAEAELCVSSYRTRLHRAKTEMHKSKALDVSEATSDVKKTLSPNYSRTDPKPLHEAASRKTSNTHAPDISLPIVDDVENSVMARFNILKRREESNPANMAEKDIAGVEASGNTTQSSGVTKEPRLKHLLDTDDAVVMHSQGNSKMHGPLVTEDVDHSVMARLNILKSRGDLDRVYAEQGVSRDGGRHAQASEEGVGTSVMHNHFGSFTAGNASSFGWEYVIK